MVECVLFVFSPFQGKLGGCASFELKCHGRKPVGIYSLYMDSPKWLVNLPVQIVGFHRNKRVRYPESGIEGALIKKAGMSLL